MSGPASAAPPTCRGSQATIVGTSGDDTLRGTAGRDVIVGLGGNDRLIGLSGNDVLCGGPGMDVLLGGSGNDRLYGGRDGYLTPADADNGALFGDYLEGGSGNDLLNAGGDPRKDRGRDAHRDVISFAHSGSGVRVDLRKGIARGDGRDRIARGLVHILGTRKDDTIKAGRPSLMATTGSGDDTIVGSGRADVLSPDSNTTGVKGVRRDPFIGTGGSDTVRGRGGNDGILSLRGKDRLLGGGGNDRLTSFSGRIERVSAGRGNDRIAVEPRLTKAPLSIRFGGRAAGVGDRDELSILVKRSPDTIDWDLDTGILRADGRTYRVDGAAEIFWGTSNDSTSLRVRGTDESESLNAQDSGPVDFIAGKGSDVFYGSVKADRFDGGPGNDTYEYDAGIDPATSTCVSVEKDRYGFCA